MANPEDELAEHLASLASGLYPCAQDRPALLRLLSLAYASPALLYLLVEPWQIAGLRKRLFYACAELHLYSRVLDDAVDIGNAGQRLAMLKFQPMFWANVQNLAVIKPDFAEAGFGLIAAACAAAAESRDNPEHWARKNWHLLLLPLYQCDTIGEFQLAQRHLALAIAVIQAEEEIAQGASLAFAEWGSFLCEAANSVVSLQAGGWPGLAARVLQGCRHIYAKLAGGNIGPIG